MRTPSITSRLLAASRQAYNINAGGAAFWTADTPAFDIDPTLGLAEGSMKTTVFVSGPDQIDAAMLFKCADCWILAFRGTFPPDSPNRAQVLLDWASDANAPLLPSSVYPGLVHCGFSKAVDCLWADISPALAPKPAQIPLYMTGHSKGGAMAQLAAFRFALVGCYVATFAAPRPGDVAFCSRYAQYVPHSARYEWQDDVVPHLPPAPGLTALLRQIPAIASIESQLLYGSVEQLHFADWSDQVVGDSPVLQAERTLRLVKLLAGFQFEAIIRAHSIAPGSGYAKAFGQ